MIRELTLPDCYYVCRFMRKIDRDEVFAVRWTESIDDLAIDLYRTVGPKYCVIKNDEPIVIGGVANYSPGVGSAWMIATGKLHTVALETTRFGKQLFAHLLNLNLHRIFVYSAEFHTESHAWLETLGMHRESVAPRMGKHGEDFICYAMLKEEL